MFLFISHASEDQNDFVRPLAEALRKDHKVWYSEYELTVGVSLLEKIDEGLAACDFGIVALSKAFFEKKWPRAELDGLFARETRSHKMILPIWHNVTEEDVKRFSPILAGRLAVSTSEGLEKVIQQINLALAVSAQQRKLTVMDTPSQRVQKLRQTVADKRYAEQMLYSERGVELIAGSIKNLFEIIQATLSEGEDASSPIKFGFTRSKVTPFDVSIRTVHGMYLQIHARDLAVNSASQAVLEIKIFKQLWDALERPKGQLVSFDADELKPTFRPGDQVVWASAETSKMFDTEELAGYLIEKFVRHVEDQVKAQTT